ncbi:hypothetical protein BGZ98_005909 [Dissophora globulifera]|nr:hypothetical protein BGZ98_005909 [Dissophora globulifera]
MARKIAGVTKDNKVNETLESRFGMFLASNVQGAQFSVQCVGLAVTTHMELAGDPESEGEDSTVDVLLDELNTTDGALAEADVIHDKELLRKSLEQGLQMGLLESSDVESNDQPKPAIARFQHAVAAVIMSSSQERVQNSNREQTSQDEEENVAERGKLTPADATAETEHSDGDQDSSIAPNRLRYVPGSEIPLSQLTDGESSFTGRLSKGAALLKGAIKKYKPSGMLPSGSNGHIDAVKASYTPTPSSIYTNSDAADSLTVVSTATGDGFFKQKDVPRIDSGNTVLTQTQVHYEDLGMGKFPTIHTSSRPGGHFDGTLRMSHEEVEAYRREDTKGGHPKFMKLHAYHQDMKSPTHGVVNLIDPRGISVISDIDDTIKETNVTAGARIILRNTFLKDMVEVEGMANVYRKWWNQGAAVHYVSNSPWQLIPSLLDFFRSHMFPPGSAHLRLHDSMFKTYFAAPGESKKRAIKEILTDFPDRKFILVGDSGEIDMEIYTEMAKAYPDQIFRIFIRDITTQRLKDMASKTPPARSRPFSSLLLPKAPITAVTTGFGLFSRRGTGSSTPGSTYGDNISNQSNHSGISSNGHSPLLNPLVLSNLRMEEGDEDDNHLATSSPTELSEEDVLEMARKAEDLQARELRHDKPESDYEDDKDGQGGSFGSFSPRLEASRPLQVPLKPAATPPSNSPGSSPRQQAKLIGASFRAMTSSLMSATYWRSNTSNTDLNNNDGRVAIARPNSPLTHGDGIMGTHGYPFPKVGSAMSSSVATSISPKSSTVSQDDEDRDHEHQSQQRQLQMQQHIQLRRVQTATHSYSSPSLGSTPSAGPSPRHSPNVLPRGIGGGISSGHTSTTTLTAMSSSATMTTTASSSSIMTTSTSATLISTSPDMSAMRIPLSTSPSASSSFASSSTFSITKTSLEIWQDRVEQCKQQLPEGMLTLFESADELDQCQVVREMFSKYHDIVEEAGQNVDAAPEEVTVSNLTSPSQLTSSSSSSTLSSVASISSSSSHSDLASTGVEAMSPYSTRDANKTDAVPYRDHVKAQELDISILKHSIATH